MPEQQKVICEIDGQLALSTFLSDVDDRVGNLRLSQVTLEMDQESAAQLLVGFFERKKCPVTEAELMALPAADLVPAMEELITKTDPMWGIDTRRLFEAISNARALKRKPL